MIDSNDITLQVSDVTKSFGNLKVLTGLDLSVKDKELLVLLGPSGCGKTTLLRIISGLIEADSGSVYLHGKNITHEAPNKRDIGLVFQDYALFPHMTVGQNIAFGLQMRNLPKQEIEKRVEEALEFVRLEGLGKRRIAQLSGGQQQRVALARAIVIHPSLLLLDEPLSNLDAILRASVRVEIAQMQKRLGVTTILVTHDQVEAMTMADCIVLMNDGVIQQSDSPINLYEKPSNLFVALFIGSPKMNTFSVDITNDRAFFTEFSESRPLELIKDSLCLKTPSESIPPGKYILGVRPEGLIQMNEINDTSDSSRTFNAKVFFIETLGSDTYFHLNLGGKIVIIRSPPTVTDVKVGDDIGFSIYPHRGHLFDAASEKRAAFID